MSYFEPRSPSGNANRRFWNHRARVRGQQIESPFLFWYQAHLVESAQRLLEQRFDAVRTIQMVCCGTGREVCMIRIGTVHHRWGRIRKPSTFYCRRSRMPLDSHAAIAEIESSRTWEVTLLPHYFTNRELGAVLDASGFDVLDVRSLAVLRDGLLRPCRTASGDNPLTFIGAAL